MERVQNLVESRTTQSNLEYGYPSSFEVSIDNKLKYDHCEAQPILKSKEHTAQDDRDTNGCKDQ